MGWKIEGQFGGVYHRPGGNIVVTGKEPSRDTLIKCHMVGLVLWIDDLELGEVEWVEEAGRKYGCVLP